MMRALWTAASGMTAQQMNVDTISNNLANVNTTGFKKERLEFQSLLYETMSKANLNDSGQGKPVNLQVGHGVRPVATARMFESGSLQRTDNTLDFAIEGDGFFSVRKPDGSTVYTKDGSFKISVVDGNTNIVTSDGYQLLGVDGEPISIPSDMSLKNITIDPDGKLSYTSADGTTEDLGMQFNIVQFSNVQGLEAIGSNFYTPTGASGQAISETDDSITKKSNLAQGFIEASNVQVAEEMVKLIVAQRAYELNSKAIQTSDDMLSTANQLKRG